MAVAQKSCRDAAVKRRFRLRSVAICSLLAASGYTSQPTWVQPFPRRAALLPAAVAILGTTLEKVFAEETAVAPARECLAVSNAGGGGYKEGDCAFSAEIPSQWERVPPKNSFRLAQWKLKGSEDSEVVIFYLPIGAGIDAQLDRWEGEFTASSGSSKREGKFDVEAGTPVTLQVSGNWDGGGPSGMKDPDKPKKSDYALRGAIYPAGPIDESKGEKLMAYYIKAIGPKSVVEDASGSFNSFIASLRRTD